MSKANLLHRREVVSTILKDRKGMIAVGGLGASTNDMAAALRCAAEGARVAIVDVNEASGQEVVDLIRAAGGTAARRAVRPRRCVPPPRNRHARHCRARQRGEAQRARWRGEGESGRGGGEDGAGVEEEPGGQTDAMAGATFSAKRRIERRASSVGSPGSAMSRSTRR